MHFLPWIHNKNNLLFYVTFLLSVPGTETKLIDKLPVTASLFCSTVPHIKRNGSCCEQVIDPHNARSHMLSRSFNRASRMTCLDTQCLISIRATVPRLIIAACEQKGQEHNGGPFTNGQLPYVKIWSWSRSHPSLLARLKDLNWVSLKEG